MSAALPTARLEVERLTPWRGLSTTRPEASFPERCSKSSEQQRNWRHKDGRLVCNVMLVNAYKELQTTCSLYVSHIFVLFALRDSVIQ